MDLQSFAANPLMMGSALALAFVAYLLPFNIFIFGQDDEELEDYIGYFALAPAFTAAMVIFLPLICVSDFLFATLDLSLNFQACLTIGCWAAMTILLCCLVDRYVLPEIDEYSLKAPAQPQSPQVVQTAPWRITQQRDTTRRKPAHDPKLLPSDIRTAETSDFSNEEPFQPQSQALQPAQPSPPSLTQHHGKPVEKSAEEPQHSPPDVKTSITTTLFHEEPVKHEPLRVVQPPLVASSQRGTTTKALTLKPQSLQADIEAPKTSVFWYEELLGPLPPPISPTQHDTTMEESAPPLQLLQAESESPKTSSFLSPESPERLPRRRQLATTLLYGQTPGKPVVATQLIPKEKKLAPSPKRRRLAPFGSYISATEATTLLQSVTLSISWWKTNCGVDATTCSFMLDAAEIFRRELELIIKNEAQEPNVPVASSDGDDFIGTIAPSRKLAAAEIPILPSTPTVEEKPQESTLSAPEAKETVLIAASAPHAPPPSAEKTKSYSAPTVKKNEPEDCRISTARPEDDALVGGTGPYALPLPAENVESGALAVGLADMQEPALSGSPLPVQLPIEGTSPSAQLEGEENARHRRSASGSKRITKPRRKKRPTGFSANRTSAAIKLVFGDGAIVSPTAPSPHEISLTVFEDEVGENSTVAPTATSPAQTTLALPTLAIGVDAVVAPAASSPHSPLALSEHAVRADSTEGPVAPSPPLTPPAPPTLATGADAPEASAAPPSVASFVPHSSLATDPPTTHEDVLMLDSVAEIAVRIDALSLDDVQIIQDREMANIAAQLRVLSLGNAAPAGLPSEAPEMEDSTASEGDYAMLDAPIPAVEDLIAYAEDVEMEEQPPLPQHERSKSQSLSLHAIAEAPAPAMEVSIASAVELEMKEQPPHGERLPSPTAYDHLSPLHQGPRYATEEADSIIKSPYDVETDAAPTPYFSDNVGSQWVQPATFSAEQQRAEQHMLPMGTTHASGIAEGFGNPAPPTGDAQVTLPSLPGDQVPILPMVASTAGQAAGMMIDPQLLALDVAGPQPPTPSDTVLARPKAPLRKRNAGGMRHLPAPRPADGQVSQPQPPGNVVATPPQAPNGTGNAAGMPQQAAPKPARGQSSQPSVLGNTVRTTPQAVLTNGNSAGMPPPVPTSAGAQASQRSMQGNVVSAGPQRAPGNVNNAVRRPQQSTFFSELLESVKVSPGRMFPR
ncbi:hypothetical protein BAUCODRAFT_347468 [Baudoinia panamericana UAMH 10762]|uniref:Uncharacterized protein n=1 Tax=Baudoinia panamericana (strain UAMH 10762) TaxID=717646 RepID=M2MS75_BAUPA|nr:uncharacterized protein BAUCODRAFT_347468 [Baudoinia panamericana UAMH 10762]EMC99706.1 hypothetical protein BAUCODRAFT_347468 [Baudoinia panamericana UAMH 10762]